jgi:hypothetical protein
MTSRRREGPEVAEGHLWAAADAAGLERAA